MAAGLYSPLALLVANVGEIELATAVRACLLSLALGALATFLSWVMLRHKEKAIILATIGTIAFFSYGHVYNGLKSLGPVGIAAARHRFLLPVEAVFLLALISVLVRKPELVPPMARWLTACAWVLIALPAARLGGGLLRDEAEPVQLLEQAARGAMAGAEGRPDIFYVVLDGYGRGDALESSYGFDNKSFLDFLRSRGFYVADEAMSNYSRTILSLASSLNMDYLDRVLLAQGVEGSGRRPFIDVLHRNRVFAEFRSLGYPIVAFETGYYPTELRQADTYLTPPGSRRWAFLQAGPNAFEGMLLQTTMAKALFDFYPEGLRGSLASLGAYEYARHRERVLFTVSALSDIAAEKGGQFVFAHIVSPHPPFIFGRDGEEITPPGPFNLNDGCCEGGDYIHSYAAQLAYINAVIQVEIDEVLAASKGRTVFILQADHGPAGLLDWDAPTATAMRDRMAILSAYYLPESALNELYPSITPVNTFRTILDGLFGRDLGLVEDASYFSKDSGSELIRVEPSR